MALFQYLAKKHQTSLFLLFFLISGAAYSQTSLSLASGTAVQGGSVSLNLSLCASTASALQWTLSYSAANVASVSVAAGPALTAAGKTIQCSTGVGSLVCLASGMNSTVIGNGTVDRPRGIATRRYQDVVECCIGFERQRLGGERVAAAGDQHEGVAQ